ncbi:MAG: hypothetical protein NVSMB39_2380 [Candidatus Saccharimonadales bacterium]
MTTLRHYNHHGMPRQAKALYDHIYDIVDAFKANATDDHGQLLTVFQLSDKQLDEKTVRRLLDDYDCWVEHYDLLSNDYIRLGELVNAQSAYDRLRANLVTERIIYARYPEIKAADFVIKEKNRIMDDKTKGL